MMESIKQLAMSRGAQVLSKLVSKGFMAAAGYFGFAYEAGQVESASMAVSMAVIGGVLFGVDLLIHKFRGDKEDKETK